MATAQKVIFSMNPKQIWIVSLLGSLRWFLGNFDTIICLFTHFAYCLKRIGQPKPSIVWPLSSTWNRSSRLKYQNSNFAVAESRKKLSYATHDPKQITRIHNHKCHFAQRNRPRRDSSIRVVVWRPMVAGYCAICGPHLVWLQTKGAPSQQGKSRNDGRVECNF